MERGSEIRVFPIARLGVPAVSLLGTCFAVGPTMVATAHHVVGSDPTNLVMVLPNMSNISDYQDTSDKSATSLPLEIVAADPVRDLCILRFNASSASFPTPFQLGSTDATPVSALVLTQGYPQANFGRMVLTQQEAKIGARVLIESGGQTYKHVIVNTQAREGQSGGPVIDARTGTVVAILIGSYAPGGGGAISLGGVDPSTLHQTTHALSAEYLQGML